MKVEEWPIDKVVPYENNPRTNKNAIESVAKSLEEFGWQQPIVVDSQGIVIVGHTRLAAAKTLGIEKVPVKIANISEEKAKAYRIADNKTSDLAIWDNKKLLEELESISDDVFTGFNPSEVFDDVLDEKDRGVMEENEFGITYSLSFSTQDRDVLEKVRDYITEVASLE